MKRGGEGGGGRIIEYICECASKDTTIAGRTGRRFWCKKMFKVSQKPNPSCCSIPTYFFFIIKIS